MYVSLSKLSQESSPAGELAMFLLGAKAVPENAVVKKIIEAFNSSFSAFKSDKEAVKMLSLAERYSYEGEIKGEVRGRARGEADITNIIKELIERGAGIEGIEAMIRERELKRAATHDE